MIPPLIPRKKVVKLGKTLKISLWNFLGILMHARFLPLKECMQNVRTKGFIVHNHFDHSINLSIGVCIEVNSFEKLDSDRFLMIGDLLLHWQIDLK